MLGNIMQNADAYVSTHVDMQQSLGNSNSASESHGAADIVKRHVFVHEQVQPGVRDRQESGYTP